MLVADRGFVVDPRADPFRRNGKQNSIASGRLAHRCLLVLCPALHAALPNFMGPDRSTRHFSRFASSLRGVQALVRYSVSLFAPSLAPRASTPNPLQGLPK